MFTLKLPGVSPALSSLLLHFVSVFVLAFGGQLVAGATNVVSTNTLLALLDSAAAAGVIAVIHVALGLIPSPATSNGITANFYGVSLKVKTAGYQLLTSLVVMFLSIFGAQLVAGAAGITSLPTAVDAVAAALSAAVAAIVGYVIGLIPAPKAVTA